MSKLSQNKNLELNAIYQFLHLIIACFATFMPFHLIMQGIFYAFLKKVSSSNKFGVSLDYFFIKSAAAKSAQLSLAATRKRH